MVDLSFLLINDINSRVVLHEPEDSLNISPLPLANMVSSPLLLNNN